MNITRVAILVGLLSALGCDNDPLLYERAIEAKGTAGIPDCAAQDGWTLTASACPDHPGCYACVEESADKQSSGTMAGCFLPTEKALCAARCGECLF